MLPAPSIRALVVGLLSSLIALQQGISQEPARSINVGGIDFVLIPKGNFTQGSPLAEAQREDDELQREVTISQDFYVSVKPISIAAWRTFAEQSRYRSESEIGTSGGFGVADGKLLQRRQFTWRNPGYPISDDQPVGMVTWDDAMAFCRWFSATHQRTATLPTEAQWERACRAGSNDARYAEPVDGVAWHSGNSSGAPAALGRHPANAWGVHDCYGPMWQWCLDWYAPYQAGPVTDPIQTNANLSDKPRRVLRGGSFLSGAARARSAERYRNNAKSRNADNGFRIVLPRVKEARAQALPMAERPEPQVSALRNSPQRSTNAPAPMPAARAMQRSSSTSTSLMLPGIIITFLFIVAFKLRRWFSSLPTRPRAFSGFPSPAPARMRMPLQTHFQQDGFWINGSADLIGQAITYSYLINGNRHEDSVIYNPGPDGHFIFTGQRPETATVMADDGDGFTPDLAPFSRLQNGDSPSSSSTRSSSLSRTYPRAY